MCIGTVLVGSVLGIFRDIVIRRGLIRIVVVGVGECHIELRMCYSRIVVLTILYMIVMY